MVCCMYYTDVFVGSSDNINNLKNALKAELEGSELTGELKAQLTALADGLGNFIGYGSKGVLDGNGIGNINGGSQIYSSSYSKEASWEKLCEKCKCKSFSNSNPSRCPCSCGSSGSSVCDPKDCCENCDVRKAAKIFLGMLPCLYYGLKILWVRCNDASQWPEWSNGNISTASDLKKFLEACGFTDKDLNTSLQGSSIPSLLNTLINDSKGSLDKIYNVVSKKYFPSPSPVSPSDSKDPLTVRQMLLWLYGLRFTSGFHDLVSHCSSLCLPFGNSFHPDAFCYYLHVSCFLLPVSIISTIQDSQSHVGDLFSDAHSEISKFSYPSDPSALADMLFEYVRKVFPALKFLSLQCGKDKDNAGWRDCAFGQSCVTALQNSLTSSTSNSLSTPSCCSDSGSHGILCTGKRNVSNCHEHCTKPGASCRGLDECNQKTASGQAKAHSGSQPCSNPCPHPLLMFLLDGSLGSDPGKSYSLFRLPKDSSVPPMGFSPDKLSSPGRNGHVLHAVLKVFCKDGFCPLTRLVQFALCIFRNPPETLGELFAFFLRFSFSDVFKDFESYVDGEPGWPDGGALQKAIQNLYGSHSGNSHSADLYSLYNCDASGSTCGKYLFPLYNVYNNNIFIDDFMDTYLSWVCYSAEDFKKKLEEFQGEFSSSSCCPSGSSCKKIASCPCILPKFYKYGFTFWSPKGLNNGKKCSQFIDQLKKVLQSNAPLDLLIKQIEAFLWSIRLPFVYTFLYIWILVISYFYYVQFYKLDLLHIDSHLHLPRSFKILPSTLFSDASSRLKDLSYFTL
ncbi:variant erythrocyte surface antigen-1 family protein [Babesia divergens]|uniref:Variant erythrocyte surface antigen-1 family protein n=1 Tax=Babesia divergens TaxID=32595 RepID=A0AAD9GCL4_BABDI|nr:variant erythrocyte surface antigen-1 family protein [Babesia divergens]